jgi:mono/diheme cytochrome c family protein
LHNLAVNLLACLHRSVATGFAALRLPLCLLLLAASVGCAKTATTSSTSTAAPETSVAPASTAPGRPVAAAGDAVHGKQIFSANCASCHGATGTEGGVGPSLEKEKSRKDFDQAVAWIKNPTPPMPKLYPSPLSDKDVTDVATYVESL